MTDTEAKKEIETVFRTATENLPTERLAKLAAWSVGNPEGIVKMMIQEERGAVLATALAICLLAEKERRIAEN